MKFLLSSIYDNSFLASDSKTKCLDVIVNPRLFLTASLTARLLPNTIMFLGTILCYTKNKSRYSLVPDPSSPAIHILF